MHILYCCSLILSGGPTFLYNLSKDKLTGITEKPFKKEKDLQALCEKNLEAIFGVKYIRSEFAFNSFRIDTGNALKKEMMLALGGEDSR